MTWTFHTTITNCCRAGTQQQRKDHHTLVCAQSLLSYLMIHGLWLAYVGWTK